LLHAQFGERKIEKIEIVKQISQGNQIAKRPIDNPIIQNKIMVI